ncbi:MAG: hypothetical protein V1774_01290 [Candidatus Eisenbacteria bacterium]
MAALRGRLGYIVAAVVLILVPLVFLWEMAIEGREPDAPDTQAARPLGVWAREATETLDELPLWCPAIFSGMPSHGSFIHTPSSPFDPTRWMRLPFENNRGMRYYVSLLLGAAALYILFVRRRFAPAAALIGTLAFVLTPYSIGLIAAGHSTKLQALYLAPLIFLAIDVLLVRRSLFAAGLLAFAVAVQAWNNHPQITYYSLLLGGLYLLLILVFDRPAQWRGRGLAAGLALGLAAVALGIGLVMEPYASVIEYAPYSIRGGAGALAAGDGGGGAGWDYATAWSFPPEELITFFFPAWFGLAGEPYWGRLPFTQSTHYFGITVLVLALAGVMMGRGRRRWILLSLSLFVLLAGFGRYIPVIYRPLYELLPFFDRFRVPSMMYAFLPLLMGMLAAEGVAAILERAGATGAERTRGGGRVAARGAHREQGAASRGTALRLPSRASGWRWLLLALPLLVLWLVVGEGLTDALLSGGAFVKGGETARGVPAHYTELVSSRAALLRDSVALGLLFAGLIGALIEGLRRRMLPGWAAGVLLCAAVAADLWITDLRFYHPVARAQTQAILKEDPLIRFLRETEPPFRIAPLSRQMQEFQSNRYAAFGLESIGGYHPAKLRIYQDLIDAGAIVSFPVLSMLNVQYLVLDVSLAERGFPLVTTVAGPGGDQFVHRNPGMCPRAWFVDEVRTSADAEALLAGLSDPAFNPRRTALMIEAEAGLRPDSLGHGEVRLLDEAGRPLPFEYGPHEILLPVRVQGPRPGLLVFSEIHYPPGWRATIDGRPEAIRRVNHVLRAMWVPPGDHEVRMVAVHPALTRGIAASRISGVIVVGLLASGVWSWWRARSRRDALPAARPVDADAPQARA